MDRDQVIEIYQQVLDGKRKRFPNGFFVGNEGKTYMNYITRYLLEQRLSIPIHEIPLKVGADTLWSHRLRPPAMLYGWNYYEVIDNAYPGEFQPWEFRQVPRKYWKGEEGKNRAIEAVKYVLEEELKIPFNEIPHRVNFHFFNQYGLGGVFSLFRQSPFQVIEAVYPGSFKPWQFANVPMNCWKNEASIQEAMDDFLFNQLHFLSYEEAFLNIKSQHFNDCQLTGLFQMAFDGQMINVKKWIKRQEMQKVN
ncbi:DUF4046 domain-containing protein [Priestia megaterium]|uniref:DUF4046 domain-containing protein n=1 Tax=Priestia megaterium TaxID=1404 RepID=UPI00196AD2B3|nr:DUF4046 domain-containing protein [Priestia megaterium]QSF41936.1 DUF4046 domain-containing protein [Priestia megaterium]